MIFQVVQSTFDDVHGGPDVSVGTRDEQSPSFAEVPGNLRMADP